MSKNIYKTVIMHKIEEQIRIFCEVGTVAYVDEVNNPIFMGKMGAFSFRGRPHFLVRYSKKQCINHKLANRFTTQKNFSAISI